MTVEEIFMRLSAHMIKGLMIHDQMATAYGFMNLNGYRKCHEYHYYKESMSYRCLQDYYLKYFHKMIPEEKIENPNIIPATWYKYTKTDVDANTKRSAVKDMIKKWVEWEKDTKKILEESYKELYDAGEVCAAKKIAWFLEGTSKELRHAEEKMIDLETMNYDISVIVGEQEYLHDKYREKIHCMMKDDWK